MLLQSLFGALGEAGHLILAGAPPQSMGHKDLEVETDSEVLQWILEALEAEIVGLNLALGGDQEADPMA